MGFRGYWFNNSGTYRTNKYPHCYVGIKLPGGAIWGSFNKYDGTKRIAYGNFNKYDGTKRIAYGNFNKYDGTKRIRYGSFSKYDGTIKPAWGVFGGDIVTHTVTTFAQAEGTDLRVETQWHKLEGIPIDNATPLYDATGHKMQNPNYVIDLYYKIIVPAVNKDSIDVFFTTRGKERHTNLSLLCQQLAGSPTFINKWGDPMGAVFGSNPSRGIMFLPSFNNIDSLPSGTVLGNIKDYWAKDFQGMNDSGYGNVFLNSFSRESSIANNLLLTGVSYTDTSITYSINPSFATCGIPITDTSASKKYLMPELRSGFVLIDNINLYNVDTYSCGALYMCLDVHKI